MENSAKEMFEKLGYEYKINEYEINITKRDRQWRENGYISINFDIQGKTIDFVFEGNVSGNLPLFITIKELQAINQQVKELGWYE